MAPSQDTLNKILSAMNVTFEMTKKGGNIYVGIEIDRDRSNNVIFIHKKYYIDQLLTRFGMSNANPVSIPTDPHTKLRPHTKADAENTTCKYQVYKYEMRI